MTSKIPRVVRQTALLTIVVGLVGGSMVYALATAPAGASMQASGFTVEDASVEASAIERIDILGSGLTAEWSDLPSEPTDVEVVYEVENPDGSMQEVGGPACAPVEEHYDCWYDGNASSGEVYWSTTPVNIALFETTDWTVEDFEPAPGEEQSHTITVGVRLTVEYDGGSVTVEDSDTTTLTVTNPETEEPTTEEQTTEAQHDPSLSFAEYDDMSVEIETAAE